MSESKPINSTALAALIEASGGVIVPGNTLRFDLPVSEVRKVVPQINGFHDEVHVRRVSERREQNPDGTGLRGIVTLECYRSDERRYNLPWAT
jgi:hypothetical protein